MSTASHISEISKTLGEPEWFLSWREKEVASLGSFSETEQYGIGITALKPEGTPSFDAIAEYHVTPSKGLELYTWKEALAQEEVASMLERLFFSELLPNATNALGALARASFQSGLVVYVQPTLDDSGHPLEETLTLETTIPSGSGADMLIVIAKTGSRLRMESILRGGNDKGVFARTVVVLTEEGVQIAIASSADRARGFLSLESLLLIGAHSSCEWVEDPDVSERYRSHTQTLLVGEAASCEILHTLLSSGSAAHDVWAGATHAASNTHSRVYAHGIAADSSHIIYRGKIDMKSGLANIDGAQEGKFLALSREALIDAVPALDIASKDVHSSHQLSVSHIRDIDLFYAKTRGISDASARTLAIEGFFGTLLNKLHKETLLDRVCARAARIVSGDQAISRA